MSRERLLRPSLKVTDYKAGEEVVLINIGGDFFTRYYKGRLRQGDTAVIVNKFTSYDYYKVLVTSGSSQGENIDLHRLCLLPPGRYEGWLNGDFDII